MRKITALLVAIVFSFTMLACGQPKEINGVKYDTYGFLNADVKRNPNIHYELSAGNIFWSIVFVETIFVPIYFFGFDLYNPIGPNDNTFIPGKI